MDPQASMINHAGDFQSPPFNLAEIWQFPFNAGGNASSYSFPPAPQTDPMVLDRRTEDYTGSVRKRREEDESAKGVSTSGNGLTESDSKRLKTTRSNENCESRGDGEGNSGKSAKPAEPPKDFIHVRARRGQATDSHSLAERARREKISERMKVLQDIVPGCNKCHRLHGYPSDYKFNKNKKGTASCVQTEGPSNVGTSTSNVVPPTNVLAGFTKEQSQQIMHLFNQTYISPPFHSEASTCDDVAFASFAGPFSEEATGNW